MMPPARRPTKLAIVSLLVYVFFSEVPAAAQQGQSTPGDVSPATNLKKYVDDVGNGHRMEIRSEPQDASISAYLQDLLAQLKKSWLSFIPDEASNGRFAQITTVFRIHPDGKLSAGDPQIETSSGNAKLDDAAVYAIRYWHQYDRLPPGFAGETLTVHASFSYNVGARTRIEVPPTGTGSASATKFPVGRYGIDILSDTQGVNFTPYLNRMLAFLEQTWHGVMPEEARMGTKGVAYVTFEILPNGSVPPENLQLERSSGQTVFDKAALDAVNNSAPFEALPHEFHGPYLKLRIVFLYNLRPEDVGLKPGKE
jgi:TonB family protein